MNNKLKLPIIFSLLLLTTLSLTACTANTEISPSVSELTYNSLYDKTLDSYEITNKKELHSISKYDTINLYKEQSELGYKESLIYHKADDFIYKHSTEKLYNEKTRYTLGDLVKIDINKISTSNNFSNFDNILLAYATVNIHPKLNVLHNDIILAKNNDNKFYIYGKLIIKNSELTDTDKNFFRQYAETYKNRVTYNDDVIIVKFNMDADHSDD